MSRVIRVALLSRFAIVGLQFISNRMIPDHEANVFYSPKDPHLVRPLDPIIDFLLGGFRRWDAEYYLHIAEHGYSYENTLAFYPLFPALIHFFTRLLLLPLNPFISFRELALIVALFMNIVFFLKAAQALAQLTDMVFKNPSLSNRAVLLFSFNPASIFFSAPYTESLFAWLTFSVITGCAEKRFTRAVLPLCLSIACRSNGILNLGFFFFYIIQDLFRRLSWRQGMLLPVWVVYMSLLTFGLIQFYQYDMFCRQQHIRYPESVVNHAKLYDLVLAGTFPRSNPSWCHQSIPMAYAYVQSHYWNVGFLNYYELKQIPNFALALPIIALFTYNLFVYFRDQWRKIVKTPVHLAHLIGYGHTEDQRIFVFMVHAAVLTLLCVFFVHIQVSTRLLASASPCLYWFGPLTIPSFSIRKCGAGPLRLASFDAKSKATIAWCMGYIVMGTSMFCNYFPWT